MIVYAPRSKNEITYEDAILYCTFCDWDGYSNWRLPTWAEYIKGSHIGLNAWYDGSVSQLLWYAVPVRDI